MRPVKLKKNALRIDRRLDREGDLLAVFDLELLQRSFQESLLMARLRRRPATYLQGPGGAAR